MSNSSNETLERIARRIPVPEPAHERMLRRRDRKRRNQRIAAGVVGFAVFVAAVLTLGTVALSDRTQGPAGGAETGPVVTGPVETGSTDDGQAATPRFQTWVVTEQDLAFGESLLDAWVAGDGEAIAAMFSPEGAFDGFGPGILPELHDWFRASGWTFKSRNCERHVDTAEEDDLGLGYVGCGFTYENDVTRALEMPPTDGGLALYIDEGTVTDASTRDANGVSNLFRSPDPEREDLFGPVWDTFINWIANTHPEDLGRMYDPVQGYPLLDPTSIELWQLHTDEFIDSEVLRSVEESFEFQARRICKSATDEFWARVRDGHLRGHEFYAALADISEERLAALLAIPPETEADRATMRGFTQFSEDLTQMFREQAAGNPGKPDEGYVGGPPERVVIENQLNLAIPGCWFGLGG